MMSAMHSLVMPKIGLTVIEGTLTEWKVAPDRSLRRGEVLAVVGTEKVANEIEAPPARLAKQSGIDLHVVSGSGPRGRIKGHDVQAGGRDRAGGLRLEVAATASASDRRSATHRGQRSQAAWRPQSAMFRVFTSCETDLGPSCCVSKSIAPDHSNRSVSATR
jgi:pyruvate/2-oxoglutarate dehydrogenase complex dihydrolipoamide acyltransferase (E2) component